VQSALNTILAGARNPNAVASLSKSLSASQPSKAELAEIPDNVRLQAEAAAEPVETAALGRSAVQRIRIKLRWKKIIRCKVTWWPKWRLCCEWVWWWF
jgi:hypothetical protein